MKKMMALVLTLGLLFSCARLASAELLFGASAEMGESDFTALYSSSGYADFSDSARTVMLNGELNLVATRLYLEYSQTDLAQASFSSYGLKTGWELGPGILKAQILGGLQGYEFEDDHNSAWGSTSVIGLVGGAGLESKVGKVKFSGSVLAPLLIRATNDRKTDNSASITNFGVGVSYALLPMLDVFLNYRNIKVESDFLTLESRGYSLGAQLSF
jgi:predicted porin